MDHYDFDTAWKKYLSGQLTPEGLRSFIEYFENNPLNEIAVFESEKDRIGRSIKMRLYANTIRHRFPSGCNIGYLASGKRFNLLRSAVLGAIASSNVMPYLPL